MDFLLCTLRDGRRLMVSPTVSGWGLGRLTREFDERMRAFLLGECL